MTIRDTRTILIRSVLRSGSRAQIARLFDRMGGADLSRTLDELTELELRRAAGVLFAADRLGRTVRELDDHALSALLAAAPSGEACGVLRGVPPRDAARLLAPLSSFQRGQLLEALDEPCRQQVRRALPRPLRGDNPQMSAVLRLRRLFA